MRIRCNRHVSFSVSRETGSPPTFLMAGGAANAAASQRTERPAFQRLLLRAGRCLILFHVKRSQSECNARYKRAPGACTYCADLNTSAIRAHALLVTHRVDQVDAPNHRFTHRSYEKHRQRAHRMQQALSLLVGIHSSFNVGRALGGSLQLCRLPHASTSQRVFSSTAEPHAS